MNSNGLTVLVPSPRAMINLSDACKALARATTGLEVKKIRDIAVAMAAFARAQQHGQAAYYEANEIRVRAERRYGELRTIAPAKVKPHEKGRGKKAADHAAISKIDDAAGVDSRRAREWEQLAKLPEDVFEEALRLSKEEQREHASTAALLRLANGGRVNAKFSSESVEWYTPAKYIEAARHVLGAIDLDPASSLEANKIVGATNILTRKDDGLSKPWDGRVWLNPPYALIDGESSAGKWGAKLIEEYRAGRCTAAVLLVNAVTDAGWFQPLFDFPICFTDHRIEFYTPTGQPRSPVSGNAFVYFGDHTKDFARAFAELGRTMKAVES